MRSIILELRKSNTVATLRVTASQIAQSFNVGFAPPESGVVDDGGVGHVHDSAGASEVHTIEAGCLIAGHGIEVVAAPKL